MPGISLSDLQEAVDKSYGDFTIDLDGTKILTFTAALRLPKAKRQALIDLQNRKMVGADDFMDFKTLETTLGDDPASWAELFEMAGKVETLGEA